MNTEIICSLITAAGVIISGLIAWFVSKSQANKEIEKMVMEWKHIDAISSDEDFSKMAMAVSRYIQDKGAESRLAAAEQINYIRSKETGDLFWHIDLLYRSINILSEDGQPDFRFIDDCLSKAIEEHRKAKRHSQAGN